MEDDSLRPYEFLLQDNLTHEILPLNPDCNSNPNPYFNTNRDTHLNPHPHLNPKLDLGAIANTQENNDDNLQAYLNYFVVNQNYFGVF
jgi:hypothetical protein